MDGIPAGRGVCQTCGAEANLIRVPVADGRGGAQLSRRLLAAHAKGREGLPALASQLCQGGGTRAWTETQPEGATS